ncbi:MAG: TFIIB-type zinc ribbon-containing protein [Promethearchaeota archaeon]
MSFKNGKLIIKNNDTAIIQKGPLLILYSENPTWLNSKKDSLEKSVKFKKIPYPLQCPDCKIECISLNYGGYDHVCRKCGLIMQDRIFVLNGKKQAGKHVSQCDFNEN